MTGAQTYQCSFVSRRLSEADDGGFGRSAAGGGERRTQHHGSEGGGGGRGRLSAGLRQQALMDEGL